MTETQHAIDRLTKPWSDVLTVDGGYRAVDYEPLLDMLRNAIASSLGRTEGGRSEADARNVINAKAFTLWERIDGQTRSWLNEMNVPAPRDLKKAVWELHVRVGALWAASQIQETQYLRFGAMARKWADEVWALFDPPVQKEIVGACPSCGERHSYGQDGGQSSAIYAYYWRGVQPAAECRRCQREWRGEKQLLELGRQVGATVDEDTLREMGVL